MNNTGSWTPAPETVAACGGEVHVWRASLDVPPELLEDLWATLAADERQRAARFRFPSDRNHFVAARGVLRDILARYLGADPATIRFVYGPFGKPALPDPAAVRFNVSHSHGLALYAVAAEREVGVDIELVQPRLAVAGSDPEAFFRNWACREAYTKATGKGLSLSLDNFDPAAIPGWTIHDLEVDPRYRAALAVEGAFWTLRQFHWGFEPSRPPSLKTS